MKQIKRHLLWASEDSEVACGKPLCNITRWASYKSLKALREVAPVDVCNHCWRSVGENGTRKAPNRKLRS